MAIRHRKSANKAKKVPYGVKTLTPDERALFVKIARQGYVTTSERDELRYIMGDGDFPQCTTRILLDYPPGSPESVEAVTEWKRWQNEHDEATGKKIRITEADEQKAMAILDAALSGLPPFPPIPKPNDVK